MKESTDGVDLTAPGREFQSATVLGEKENLMASTRDCMMINVSGPNLNPYCIKLSLLGMYRIAISKIRPEPDSIGYQMNYPAGTGTGYLNTCCIANFLVLCVV